MANIYQEANQPLHELLDKARSGDGATVLIPDLQRPYVWTPTQVVLLVDSLIRGWPFGTLLMWKIGNGEIQNIPHRPFWQVADRTDGASGSTVVRKDPPASYHMVLDGQQRVQSLLLALGGDAWGFKMDDRAWAEELQNRFVRGRQGKYRHWSKACLCFDLDQFLADYRAGAGLLGVDFRNVMRWVVTDPIDGQSDWPKPDSYVHPLLKASAPENTGRFIRFSRLWTEAVPNPNIKESVFKEKVAKLFETEGVPRDKIETALGPMGELMTTLRDLKLSKITYLELQPFDRDVWKEDDYNDAIVNIFTRLNTAGRTLTREEITLAWLKVGWDATATSGKSAGECFEGLLEKLKQLGLRLAIDDLVGAVSVIWAVTQNGGKLLENSDLLKGRVIRPMAAVLAANWSRIERAVVECTEAVRERDLEYGAGEQYSSLNSLAVLWAWEFLALTWEETHGLRERPKDDFRKKCRTSFDSYVDRWIFGSQWAGRWVGSASLAKYAKELSADVPLLMGHGDLDAAHGVLDARLQSLAAEVIEDATKYVETLSTRNRERVVVYRILLWVWHRLEKERWAMSKVQLRTGRSKKTPLDVDHTVAYALWGEKLNAGLPAGVDEKDEAQTIVNRLGNCSLLEKSFNISKSDKTLKSFMEEVHEFKAGKVQLKDWAKSLGITDSMVDPSTAAVDVIVQDISDREHVIRREVIEFVKGTRARVDLDAH